MSRSQRSGQASLEMTTAFIGMLLILLATAKVMFWGVGRLYHRQQYYERTRPRAGRQSVAQARRGIVWNDPTRTTSDDPCDHEHYDNQLRIFEMPKYCISEVH